MHNNKVVPFAIDDNHSVAEFLQKSKDISFQGRSLGVAFEIWQSALKDNATIFLGLSGAMVPAGLRKVIVYMIKNRLIDCIVSTGANLFHDLYETFGYIHYKCSPNVNDIAFREQRLDRMYDVYANDGQFNVIDKAIADFAASLPKRPYTTREFFYLLGKEVAKKAKEEGIVTSASKAGVPIYVPAIGDSSYGIALACGINKKTRGFLFDVIGDVYETAMIAAKSPVSGIVFIGGGTPKNFTQQTEVTAELMGFNVAGHKYCIQITTDAPHWGGLSGCTFEESQSWGKIHFKANKVAVYCDATIGLPLLVSGLAEINAGSLRKSIPVFTQGETLEINFEKIQKAKKEVSLVK